MGSTRFANDDVAGPVSEMKVVLETGAVGSDGFDCPDPANTGLLDGVAGLGELNTVEIGFVVSSLEIAEASDAGDGKVKALIGFAALALLSEGFGVAKTLKAPAPNPANAGLVVTSFGVSVPSGTELLVGDI